MRRGGRSHPRRIWWIVGAVFGVFLFLPAAGLTYLFIADLRPMIQRVASSSLGREVTIGDLRLAWGRYLNLEIRDLRVANAEWSGSPDIMRIDRLTVVVYLPALARGVVQYDVLRLEGSEMLLERRNDGERNWRFGRDAPSVGRAKAAGLALVPQNRRQFPDVKDLQLRDLLIVYRSEGRQDIRIDLADAKLAPDASGGARLTAGGAYNGIPLKLEVAGGSYAEMRDATQAYPAEFIATSGSAKIAFKGVIDEPLDFDGVRGGLTLDIADFAAFLKLFGYVRPLDFPVMLQGALDHAGDRWALAALHGIFRDSRIAGSFVFTEGARGQPDAASVDADLDRFDLKTLLQGIAEPAASESAGFRPELAPATTLEVRIGAKAVAYGDIDFDDVRLHGRLMPGEVAADELSFGFAGGRIMGDGALRARGADGAATLQVVYEKANVARLARLAGLDDGLLSGGLDGRLSLAMTGPTFDKALASSEGHAVVVMASGEISRALLEMISLDPRALFRRNSQATDIQCFLVVADIRKGNARLMPVILNAAEARLSGGALDLASGQIDALLRSDPKSTGSLALDLPLRVTGPLDNPSVSPRLDGAPAWLAEPQPLPAALDPASRALASRRDCTP
jgi:uncharacterized protein involved in outer membrane biogenesis